MNKKIKFLEEIGANGHVALNILQYDGWILRFSNGYTRRANSISVIYPSQLTPEEKVPVCEEYYKRQGLSCLFKVTEEDVKLNKFLEARGYTQEAATSLMTVNLEDVDFESKNPAVAIFFKTPKKEWLVPYFTFEGITNPKDQETFKKMLSKVLAETLYGVIVANGKIVACASVAIERGYALLQNVVVSPKHRTKGYGKHLCKKLLEKAKELGAKEAYLQVVQTNKAANCLYEDLGFKKEYEYWYMREPKEDKKS